MLQYHATNREVRDYLHDQITSLYGTREAESMLRLILEHLGTSLQSAILNPRETPGPTLITQINEIVRELHTGKPIQYILGYSWFFDLKIGVNENVLIPRQETEELIHRIRESHGDHPRDILDLGTGSGCIALALKSIFPGASVQGMELSQGALEVARNNGQFLALDVNWIHGDMLELLPHAIRRPFDLIVSNPPYVRRQEKAIMATHVLAHEPWTALFVEDDDPLLYYRGIAAIARDWLAGTGTLWLEINEALGRETVQLLEKNKFRRIVLHQDIHGKDRFIQARRK